MKIKLRKKTLISFAVALFMVISLMPGNVLKSLAADAVELSQADFEEAYTSPGVKTAKGIIYVIDAIEPTNSQYVLDVEGTYKLTENLDLPTIGGSGTLFAAEDVIINLNGKELAGTLAFGDDSVSMITGNGKLVGESIVKSVLVNDQADVTIESGMFLNQIDISSYEPTANTKLTINDGIFKNSIYAGTYDGTGKTTLCVNGGTFGDTEQLPSGANIYVWSNADLTINGGIFTSLDTGIEAFEESNNCSIVINGGSFTGFDGIRLDKNNSVKISEGTFKSNDDGYGIICNGTTDISNLNSILAEGSSYDPELQATAEEANGVDIWIDNVHTQKEISVVKSVTKYTVTFYDGETKISDEEVNSGEKVSKPTSNPTKDGYTFDKWCSDSALTTAFDFDKAIADNTNIYAKWTKNEEPTPEEPTPEKPTPEEPTPEEPTPEEPTPEKPTPEEPTPVDPTPATGTLTKIGIYCAQDNPSIIAAFLTERSVEADTVEYRWLACEESNPNAWFVVSDWTKGNYYLSWTPEKSGDYIIVAQARLVGNEEKTLVYDSFGVNFRTVNAKIKDICQMPYEGGYLIGIESTANPNQSLKYEMLVMDLSLYAAGNPNCWVHSVKGGVAEGNALWTIWKPQYGYYVTLFRIYDANDNLLDQTAYGFANAY